MSDIKKYFTEQTDTGSWLVREQIILPNEPMRVITLFADLEKDQAKKIAEALNE